MNCNISTTDGTVRVSLNGSLTADRVLALHRQIAAVYDAAGLLELDLCGVTDCDSAGLQLIYSLKSSMVAAGGSVELTDVPECVWRASARIGLPIVREARSAKLEVR